MQKIKQAISFWLVGCLMIPMSICLAEGQTTNEAIKNEVAKEAIEKYQKMLAPPIVTIESLADSTKHIEWFVNFSPTEQEAVSDIVKEQMLKRIKEKLSNGELLGQRDDTRKIEWRLNVGQSNFMQGKSIFFGGSRDEESTNGDSSGFSYGF